MHTHREDSHESMVAEIGGTIYKSRINTVASSY